MTTTAIPTPQVVPAAGDALVPQRVTPEQMARLPDDGKLYELVDGQLVEKAMSDLAHLVANNLNDELIVWSKRVGGGRSFVEATFRCFPHASEMVRRPDVAYVSRERLAGYRWGQAYLAIAPDLAVEVISPTEQVADLDLKIQDYYQAGVRRVWVMNPDLRIVRIHRGPGDIAELVGDADLTDEQVLPGFRCPLPVLFARPGTTTAPPQAPIPAGPAGTPRKDS